MRQNNQPTSRNRLIGDNVSHQRRGSTAHIPTPRAVSARTSPNVRFFLAMTWLVAGGTAARAASARHCSSWEILRVRVQRYERRTFCWKPLRGDCELLPHTQRRPTKLRVSPTYLQGSPLSRNHENIQLGRSRCRCGRKRGHLLLCSLQRRLPPIRVQVFA